MQSGGGLGCGYTFLEKSTGISTFVSLKKPFTPGNSAKLCDTPWKVQGQKPKLMGIPHGQPWKFHVVF